MASRSKSSLKQYCAFYLCHQEMSFFACWGIFRNVSDLQAYQAWSKEAGESSDAHQRLAKDTRQPSPNALPERLQPGATAPAPHRRDSAAKLNTAEPAAQPQGVLAENTAQMQPPAPPQRVQAENAAQMQGSMQDTTEAARMRFAQSNISDEANLCS